jgi:hypothetical protein
VLERTSWALPPPHWGRHALACSLVLENLFEVSEGSRVVRLSEPEDSVFAH